MEEEVLYSQIEATFTTSMGVVIAQCTVYRSAVEASRQA
jgi:hypothetical protein